MSETPQYSGALIVNADDWGRDEVTTSRSFECIRAGTVSSVSAMVFMEDSKRAAVLARQWGVDAGLHLNLSAPFTAADCPATLVERHSKIANYLRKHGTARIFYHPGLASAFRYVVGAQIDEYRRLYGMEPQRIDGHHHLHLCANVQRARLLPGGAIVRRNFSFQAGEKSWLNRFYRSSVDRKLARRHRLVDFLFNLAPLEPSRLQKVFSTARQSIVELETHPVDPGEYQFLTGGDFTRLLDGMPVATHFSVPQRRFSAARAFVAPIA